MDRYKLVEALLDAYNSALELKVTMKLSSRKTRTLTMRVDIRLGQNRCDIVLLDEDDLPYDLVASNILRIECEEEEATTVIYKI